MIIAKKKKKKKKEKPRFFFLQARRVADYRGGNADGGRYKA